MLFSFALSGAGMISSEVEGQILPSWNDIFKTGEVIFRQYIQILNHITVHVTRSRMQVAEISRVSGLSLRGDGWMLL